MSLTFHNWINQTNEWRLNRILIIECDIDHDAVFSFFFLQFQHVFVQITLLINATQLNVPIVDRFVNQFDGKVAIFVRCRTINFHHFFHQTTCGCVWMAWISFLVRNVDKMRTIWNMFLQFFQWYDRLWLTRFFRTSMCAFLIGGALLLGLFFSSRVAHA